MSINNFIPVALIGLGAFSLLKKKDVVDDSGSSDSGFVMTSEPSFEAGQTPPVVYNINVEDTPVSFPSYQDIATQPTKKEVRSSSKNSKSAPIYTKSIFTPQGARESIELQSSVGLPSASALKSIGEASIKKKTGYSKPSESIMYVGKKNNNTATKSTNPYTSFLSSKKKMSFTPIGDDL